MVNSLVPAFFIPGDKKERFLSFVRSVLANRWVSLTTLQRLSLVIPACKLYTREILAAIAYLNKNNKQVIPSSPRLREQLSYWLSLETWQQCLQWRVERHSVITLHFDSSKGAWGAVVVQDGKKTVIRDYWTDSSPHINILEASALERALHSLAETVQNTRVEAWLDSQVVVTSWQREGGRSRELNDIFKYRIVHCACQHNLELALHYLPSSSNPADVPSRTMSDLDCMLSPTAWSLVQLKFGPHSFDLCALDSNAERDAAGFVLPHTPWPTPQSAGVNVSAQHLPENHNLYVFPPIVLVGLFLRFLLDAAHVRITIVVFDIYPRRYWWPILQSRSIDSLQLGHKNDISTLLFPSPRGFASRLLQYDLRAFRCEYIVQSFYLRYPGHGKQAPPAPLVVTLTTMIPTFAKRVALVNRYFHAVPNIPGPTKA